MIARHFSCTDLAGKQISSSRAAYQCLAKTTHALLHIETPLCVLAPERCADTLHVILSPEELNQNLSRTSCCVQQGDAGLLYSRAYKRMYIYTHIVVEALRCRPSFGSSLHACRWQYLDLSLCPSSCAYDQMRDNGITHYRRSVHTSREGEKR